ncbi:hypothetical protein D3C78_541410 [compost metagenome]
MLPFDEVAALQGVQGVQLGDLGRAADAEGQRLGALQVDVQIAGEEAAAQLQTYERDDVGLGDTQVDIPGGDLEPGADRIERYLAAGLHLAAVAQTGLELEGQRRLALAVEVLQIQIQRPDIQRDFRRRCAVDEVRLVAAQLGIADQHMPGVFRWCCGFGSRRFFCRCRCFRLRFGNLLVLAGGAIFRRSRSCICRLCRCWRRGFRWWCRLTLEGLEIGEEFLPIQLAVFLACGPGFQALAADLADHHFALGQVQAGFADVEAGQFEQRLLVGRMQGEVLQVHGCLVEQQLGVFREVETVVGGQAEHAFLQIQRRVVAYIRPPGLERNALDRQAALGGDRHQAQVALPVQPAAMRAGGEEGHGRPLAGQGSEVVQFEPQRAEEEVDGLAGAAILEMQAAFGELDAVDLQREGGSGRLGARLAGRQLEQAGQVQRAVLGEQQLRMRTFQLDIRQMQMALPEAVQFGVGVEALEAELFLPGCADMQAPEGQLQTEGVELDALEFGRERGVVGQLLIRHAKGDSGEDQETQQTIKQGHQHQCADSAYQSFGHGECRFPS